MRYKTYLEARAALDADNCVIMMISSGWGRGEELIDDPFSVAYEIGGNYHAENDINSPLFLIDSEDEWTVVPDFCDNQNQTEQSGGSCNYYMVDVKNPTTLPEPYTIECNDIIESLKLTWQEANIQKEMFRTANDRTHSNGKEGNNPTRAAEKILFFALRNAIVNGVDIQKILKDLNQ